MDKVFFKFFLLLGLVASLWSCSQVNIPPIDNEQDLEIFLTDTLGIFPCLMGDSLSAFDLPTDAQNYLAQNFPQDGIASVVLFASNQDSIYQTTLSSGRVVLFDGQGDYLLDGDPQSIDEDDIEEVLESLLDSLSTYHPDLEIDEIELEWTLNGKSLYEIEFEEVDLELYVLVDGSEICFTIEGDGDDDDDDGGCGDDDDDDEHYVSTDSLPNAILQHLDNNYSDYELEECTKVDTICGSTAVYVIEAEKEQDEDLYLVYEQSGSFRFEKQEAEDNILPQAVKDSIQNNYPGYEREDDVYALRLDNGDVQYIVLLEDDESELNVLYAEDGTEICSWEADDD